MDTSQISQYKSNYLWNLLGSVSSALISTLLLLIASENWVQHNQIYLV